MQIEQTQYGRKKELFRNELAKIAFDRLLTNIGIVNTWQNQLVNKDKNSNPNLCQFTANLAVKLADELIAELEQ